MQELIAQGMTYVWGIWRHKWLALGLAWAFALVGWAFVWKLPESYLASARLYVDTNTVLRPLLQGLAITPDINQRVRMMSSTLFSRPNLEKLARMTDLDLQATTESEQEALIDGLRDSISLSGQRGNASLYNIEVVDPNREMARRITQSLITVFIESSLNEKRDDSTGAQDFLDEQIADYERRLIETEGRLARFKQQNVDVLPSKWGADYYTRLEKGKEELKAAVLARDVAVKRRDALQKQVRGDGTVDGLSAAGILTPADARIQQMRLRLDELLTRYTDRHPEVRQIKGLMADLEEQRRRELALVAEAGVPAARSSALIGDMQTLLSESEAAVAELDVRVSEFERRVTDLTSKVTQIPEVEAQLKQLNRDYEVIKGQHTKLLQRRESARLSQDIENNASDVTFRVVDPPFVPQSPSEPNKALLNALVLFAALGLGAGAALLLSLLRPIVVDARMLAQATGLPLLGVVTNNRPAAAIQSDRMKLAWFVVASSSLVAVYVALIFAPQLTQLVGSV